MSNTAYGAIQIGKLQNSELSEQEVNDLAQLRASQLFDHLPDIEIEKFEDEKPEGSKALGTYISKILLGQISAQNAKRALDFISRKMKGDPLKITVTRDKETIVIECNKKDFDEAIEKAKNLFKYME